MVVQTRHVVLQAIEPANLLARLQRPLVKEYTLNLSMFPIIIQGIFHN